MSERYDLIVIGAGPAGEKGAAQAAYFGKRVALIETGTRYIAAWKEAFLSKGLPSVGIIPSDGPHPIPLDTGAGH